MCGQLSAALSTSGPSASGRRIRYPSLEPGSGLRATLKVVATSGPLIAYDGSLTNRGYWYNQASVLNVLVR